MKTFLDFFQLCEQPFGDTPDTRFLYASRTHREALASLVWGIRSGRGFTGLIAKPGMGKTTLLFQLLKELSPTTTTAFLFQTQCDPREMMEHLLLDLGLTPERGNARMHLQMKQFLARQAASGRRVVLVIDESQNLQDPVLERLRLLSDFETESKKLVQLVLAGQPQLAERLALPKLEQLRQRMGVFARIDAFNLEETVEYIAHRLRVAGHPTGDAFTAGATRLIAEASGGIPREINAICFNALSIAFALKRPRVDDSAAREALEDHDVSLLLTSAVQPTKGADFPPHTDHVLAPMAGKSRSPSARGAAAAMLVLLSLGLGSAIYRTKTLGRWLNSSHHHVAAPGQATTLSSRTLHSSSMPMKDPHAEEPQSPDPAEVSLDDGVVIAIKVRPGQTLYSISHRYIGNTKASTLRSVCDLNPQLGDPNRIRAGSIIQLPISLEQQNHAVGPQRTVRAILHL